MVALFVGHACINTGADFLYDDDCIGSNCTRYGAWLFTALVELGVNTCTVGSIGGHLSVVEPEYYFIENECSYRVWCDIGFVYVEAGICMAICCAAKLVDNIRCFLCCAVVFALVSNRVVYFVVRRFVR